MNKSRGTAFCLVQGSNESLLSALICFLALLFLSAGTANACDFAVSERSFVSAPASIQEAYRQKAIDLWKQAADLQIKGLYEDALKKYREGLGYHEDPKVREHVWKLEETLAAKRSKESETARASRREAALELWKEAAALQQAGWFEDALRKYREGLQLSDDPRVREHVRKLETYIEHLRLRGLLPLLVLMPTKKRLDKAFVRDRCFSNVVR